MSNTAEKMEEPALSPLETILQKLDGRSGFPALSNTITDINRIVASESDSVRQLTQCILRDVSLTNKLLQVVNSATYGQFRGHIHTISKAVLILGFEAVRNAAMSLVMLEFTKGKDQEQLMRDEIISAFFSGVVAKALCEQLGVDNPNRHEEAVICTMFQNLGRLLTTFFLFEDSQHILHLINTGKTEEVASLEVLGISYRDLGVGVAKYWDFPERLVHGMQKVTLRDLTPPKTDMDKLKLAANLANELCLTAACTSDKQKEQALKAIAERYNRAIKLDSKELTNALNKGLEEIKERALTLNLSINKSPSLDVIKKWAGKQDAVTPTEPEPLDPDDTLMVEVKALDAQDSRIDPMQTAEDVLSAGIRDVTETLISDFTLNDILQMVLETMYRGMAFHHAMIFIRDPRLNSMRARFGFGEDIEQIIPQCNFPMTFAPDVFHVALSKGADIVIEDAQAENIANRIPAWQQKALGSNSFLLLPVLVKKQAIGLFYADRRSGGFKITAQQLGLLRTLRSQVALALMQKQN